MRGTFVAGIPSESRLPVRLLALSLLLVSIGAGSTAAQDDVQQPTLGATVRPSMLTLLAPDLSTSTQIRNAGNVPASLVAVVNLPSTRIEADGWMVTVDSAIIEAGEWATVTLSIDEAHASDVSLDVFMAPEMSQGTEGVVLRFPIAVDVEAATAESTGQAWIRSIMRSISLPWLGTQ